MQWIYKKNSFFDVFCKKWSDGVGSIFLFNCSCWFMKFQSMKKKKKREFLLKIFDNVKSIYDIYEEVFVYIQNNKNIEESFYNKLYKSLQNIHKKRIKKKKNEIINKLNNITNLEMKDKEEDVLWLKNMDKTLYS